MTPDEEIKEAILSGVAVEIYPEVEGKGFYARIGMLEHTVDGPSAAAVLLRLAEILATPYPEGRARQ